MFSILHGYWVCYFIASDKCRKAPVTNIRIDWRKSIKKKVKKMNRYRLKLLYDVRISEVLSYNNNNNNSKQLRLNVIATTSDSLEIDLSNMQVMRRKMRDSPSEKKEQDEREEKKRCALYDISTFRLEFHCKHFSACEKCQPGFREANRFIFVRIRMVNPFDMSNTVKSCKCK